MKPVACCFTDFFDQVNDFELVPVVNNARNGQNLYSILFVLNKTKILPFGVS